MQSDSHESDPRLQRVNPGPKVTTGFVDPCIFYLEATLPREIPVLFACWARSSSEMRKVGSTHLKLEYISVVRGIPIRDLGGWSMQDGKTDWKFDISQFIKEIHLIHNNDSGWTLRGIPNTGYFRFEPRYGCQSSLKFIDAKTDYLLARLNLDRPNSLSRFAKVILMQGPAEWLTLGNALASFKLTPRQSAKPVPDRSIIRRLISSLFTKKTKAVAA